MTVIQLGTDFNIYQPISQIVLKTFIKISLIIKECHEEILRKLEMHCPEDFKDIDETLDGNKYRT